MMRFSFRTGRNSSMSVGLLGALILGLAVLTVWVYVAIIVGAVAVLYGLGWCIKRAATRLHAGR